MSTWKPDAWDAPSAGTGLDQVETTHHPDTDAQITGAVLPIWQEALDLALNAQSLLKQVPLIGWDIAISNNGPLIIEANETPDLALMQYASGRGMLDDKFEAFVQAHREARAAEQAKLKKYAREHTKDNGVSQIKGAFKRT